MISLIKVVGRPDEVVFSQFTVNGIVKHFFLVYMGVLNSWWEDSSLGVEYLNEMTQNLRWHEPVWMRRKWRRKMAVMMFESAILHRRIGSFTEKWSRNLIITKDRCSKSRGFKMTKLLIDRNITTYVTLITSPFLFIPSPRKILTSFLPLFFTLFPFILLFLSLLH